MSSVRRGTGCHWQFLWPEHDPVIPRQLQCQSTWRSQQVSLCHMQKLHLCGRQCNGRASTERDRRCWGSELVLYVFCRLYTEPAQVSFCSLQSPWWWDQMSQLSFILEQSSLVASRPLCNVNQSAGPGDSWRVCFESGSKRVDCSINASWHCCSVSSGSYMLSFLTLHAVSVLLSLSHQWRKEACISLIHARRGQSKPLVLPLWRITFYKIL